MSALEVKTNRRKRKFFRWLKLGLLVYGIIGIALYYLQESILFHPESIKKDSVYQFSNKYDEINIPYNKETTLNIVRFKTDDSIPKGVVLYLHGNRKNIGWYSKYVSNFTQNGYEVWMMDYPGFGKSTGKFTEKDLYNYALQFYKLARATYKPNQIVIYGKSIGTGIASQLASIRDCKYLILETPYYSMTSLASHYFPIYPVGRMLHYELPTNEYLKSVTSPVIILQGTDDGVVTYRNAKKLKAVLKPNDEFITIEGGTHNNLNDYPIFHHILDSLLK